MPIKRIHLLTILASVLAVVPALAAMAGTDPDSLARQVSIRRTDYGVPHILAENYRAAGFGFAYAQAEDHLHGIMKLLMTSRGELAQHFDAGEKDANLKSDLENRQFRIRARAEATYGQLRPDLREMLLARDAFGKKPLYIYEDENFFAFASELQAFYALPGFDQTIDRETIADYLLLGYCPGPSTIYKRVRQLEPGSYLRVRFADNGVETVAAGRFFRFAAMDRPSVTEIDQSALKEKLRQRLITATEQRMISDVPLGAFLSGGVDSSLVVAIVRRELQKEINT